jgi:5-methylcytosine-specific restriction endonuclease McrA
MLDLGTSRQVSTLLLGISMKLKKYTKNQLCEAIKISYSYRQTLIKLNVSAAGGNYSILKKAIKCFDLDISHFTHQGWSKVEKISNRYVSFNTYIQTSTSIQSYKAKNKLLREKILEYICSNCNLTEWLDGPIPLELDHINGDRDDYRLENLRLLCPNCHALTSTYRGKNKTPKT